MTCQHCGDKGIIRIRYRSGEPDEFALCLCDAGMRWRMDTNAGRKTSPLWHVWAAREQVQHERIGPIEEFYSAAELLTLFPFYQAGGSERSVAEDLLLSAGRTRRAKL